MEDKAKRLWVSKGVSPWHLSNWWEAELLKITTMQVNHTEDIKLTILSWIFKSLSAAAATSSAANT